MRLSRSCCNRRVLAPQAAQLLALLAGQPLGATGVDIAQARQLPYPSDVTFPGDDFYPGEGVPGFHEAWEKTVATWRPGTYKGKQSPPGGEDAWHVESHVWDGRKVFITNDGALREMCRRLRREQSIPVVAMFLAEYLAARE